MAVIVNGTELSAGGTTFSSASSNLYPGNSLSGSAANPGMIIGWSASNNNRIKVAINGGSISMQNTIYNYAYSYYYKING
tara:strand:- start:1159 stop:1398 length:240 start_codon:yes stop_codon:yes gene_type:complete